MSQAIIEGLKTKLYADQTAGTFYAAVSGRIYENQAPQNSELPHCVFTMVNSDVERYMTGQRSFDCTVTFDIYGKADLGLEVLGDIEEKLYDLLDGVSLTVAGADRGVVTFNSRNVRGTEEDAHRITDEVRIQATEF